MITKISEMLLLKLIFTFFKLRIATICTSSLNKNFWLLLLTYPCFVEKLRKQYIFIYIHDTSNSYKIFKKRDTDKSYTFLEPRMIGLTIKIKFQKVIFWSHWHLKAITLILLKNRRCPLIFQKFAYFTPWNYHFLKF